MERLRKGTQHEIHSDIREVKKNISLIRAPEGIRNKTQKMEEDPEMTMELDEEEIEYMPALEMEKKLSAGVLDIEMEKKRKNKV